MRGVWIAALLMVGMGGAWDSAQEKAAGAGRTVLVELFTSEGCSSCPPADALLTKLNGAHTETGELIVGLSEHVTYWNSLGWADPFSQELYTRRQSAYGDRFGLDSVYTPQVVVNGEAQMVGSDGGGVLRAVQASGKAAGKASTVRLRIERASVVGDKVAVTYAVEGEVPKGAEVWAVIADDMASSKVTRGENGGRTLGHVAVARSLVKVGSGVGTMTVSLPAPGVVEGEPKTGRHVVLFAQERGVGRVLAVESKGL
jgi:hypothetical protein